MARQKKRWIQKATPKETRGDFSKKAKKVGMSTSAYATKVTKKGSKASGKTKKQAQLAKTLAKMRKKRK